MRYFRRKQNLKIFISAIAVAVFLRSFIAPGYMLTASIEDGLGIIFCKGPVSINIQQDDHSAHHHHGDNNEMKDEIHISPICSQWSTSGMTLFNTVLEPALLDTTRIQIDVIYNTPFFQRYSDTTRIIRGPPSLS